ncbi:MAG: isochorismatase family protein, partial [Hyphomicrobiales bacterium]
MHLCVDMQRMFAEDTDWHTPWMDRVLPQVVAIAERQRERTAFTRFIPLRDAEDGHGTWRRYYERWPRMTLNGLPSGMIDLLADLQRFVPPAWVIDKRHYSPWSMTELH